MGHCDWPPEEKWLLWSYPCRILCLHHWPGSLLPGWVSVIKGCSQSSSSSSLALFYTHPHHGSCSEVPHATPKAEGLLVFPSLDVIHLMDFPPRARWDPAWAVALSVWKDCSSSLLAVCGHHCLFAQSVLAHHVPHWNKRNDDQKTWNTHWCLSVRRPLKFYGFRCLKGTC